MKASPAEGRNHESSDDPEPEQETSTLHTPHVDDREKTFFWRTAGVKLEVSTRESEAAKRQRARQRATLSRSCSKLSISWERHEVDGLRSALARAQKSPSKSGRVSLPVPRNVWPHWMHRGPEVVSLEEGRPRLIRLESAALEALQVMPSPDASSEVLKLRELVSQLQAQIRGPDHQDAPCMPTVKRPCRSGQERGPVPVMPRFIPAELSVWLEERHAHSEGNNVRVLEFTPKLSKGRNTWWSSPEG